MEEQAKSISTQTTPAETLPPKPYQQQSGEPDNWYDRFHRFCLLGPSRTLIQCYRQVIAERSAAGNGRQRIPQQAPGAWKRKARELDWHARAAAWDADQRARSLQRLETTLNRICDAADKALQYQIDLMSNQLEDPIESIALIHERRMASKTIIDKAVDVYALLQQNQVEALGRIPVTEIRIHQPRTRSR